MQIAKLLVKEEVISLEQMKEAIEKKQSSGIELSEALIELGYISEAELLDFLGKSYRVPVISIEDHSIEEDVLKLIPREIAIENRLIPLSVTGSALTVAMSDPSNIILADELSFLTEKSIIPVVVSERSIINMLERYYGYSRHNSDYPELSGKPENKNEIDIDQISKELEEESKDKDYEDNGKASVALDSPESTQLDDGSSESAKGIKDEADSENLKELDSDPDLFPETEAHDEDSLQVDCSSEDNDNQLSHEPLLNETSDPSSVNEYDSDEDDSLIDKSEGLLSSAQYEQTVELSIKVEPEVERESEPPHSQTEITETSTNDLIKSKTSNNVLVIDSSPTVRKLISLALRRNGYSVSTVSDGMEALSCLHDVRPNMILIEINLPHMDGYKVCKIIKSHGLMRKVPIIMLSGKEGLVDRVRSKMAGANGHITKPFSGHEVLDTARNFMGSVEGERASGQG